MRPILPNQRKERARCWGLLEGDKKLNIKKLHRLNLAALILAYLILRDEPKLTNLETTHELSLKSIYVSSLLSIKKTLINHSSSLDKSENQYNLLGRKNTNLSYPQGDLKASYWRIFLLNQGY